jgi:hypothetical protein
MDVRLTLAALVFALIVQPAHAAPASFSCSVMGAKLLSPPETPAAICAKAKHDLEKAFRRKMADAPARTSALSITLKLTRPGTATAWVIERAGRGVVTRAPISIDMMDRAPDIKIVELLVLEIAKLVQSR